MRVFDGKSLDVVEVAVVALEDEWVDGRQAAPGFRVGGNRLADLRLRYLGAKGDEAGFLREVELIRKMGFNGKSLINPRQIDLLHNLYAPTQKEVDHARRVVEAAEAAAREGRGVVSLNGKMVDSPVIERALLVISRAELSGIREE